MCVCVCVLACDSSVWSEYYYIVCCDVNFVRALLFRVRVVQLIIMFGPYQFGNVPVLVYTIWLCYRILTMRTSCPYLSLESVVIPSISLLMECVPGH